MSFTQDALRRAGLSPGGAGTTTGTSSPGATTPVTKDDFYAYLPNHTYLFVPTRDVWTAMGVNAQLGKIGKLKASTWLDRNRRVQQMTWAPGEPMLIRNKLIAEGGWFERNDTTCFNLYREPTIDPGDPTQAGPWISHLKFVYPEDHEHITKWLAQRVQFPHIKLNHALVLGGAVGIGKDCILAPVKHAVGYCNFIETSPQQMLGRFNGFLKSVILRVNEGRDLGDFDRFKFHDHTKTFIAAPPDTLRIDEKNLREYSIINVCGVIITTNYKTDGIYIPADDRRHYVAWSLLEQDQFPRNYWNDIWKWYCDGGIQNVTAYLQNYDITSFDPKLPPPKTRAFWDIADANRPAEDAEIADVLDLMGNPDALTIARLRSLATSDLATWLNDRKNRRVIHYRLEKAGYVPVRNDANKDGFWVVDGVRCAVYAKANLSFRDQVKAAQSL